MVGGECIDQIAVGRERTLLAGLACSITAGTLPPLLVSAPVAADNPAAFWQTAGGGLDPFGESDGFMDIKQVDPGQSANRVPAQVRRHHAHS